MSGLAPRPDQPTPTLALPPFQILHLKWPGGLESPLPGPTRNKEDMAAMGYVRRPQSDHIQRCGAPTTPTPTLLLLLPPSYLYSCLPTPAPAPTPTPAFLLLLPPPYAFLPPLLLLPLLLLLPPLLLLLLLLPPSPTGVPTCVPPWRSIRSSTTVPSGRATASTQPRRLSEAGVRLECDWSAAGCRAGQLLRLSENGLRMGRVAASC